MLLWKSKGAPMEIKRSGSQSSGKGPAGYFHRRSPHRPFVRRTRTGPRSQRERHVRAGSAHRLAYAPSRPDADCVTFGAGWVQRWGGPVEAIRPGDVVQFEPRREALARRDAHHRDDAYRGSGGAECQPGRMDGTGQRRTIPRLTTDRRSRRKQMQKRKLGKSGLEVSAIGLGCISSGGPFPNRAPLKPNTGSVCFRSQAACAASTGCFCLRPSLRTTV